MVSADLRRGGASTRVLAQGTVPARVRPWPDDDQVAHLVVYRAVSAPTDHDIELWLAELPSGLRAVRTGALTASSAAPFLRAGFHEIQRLTLLEHRSPGLAAAPKVRTRRMRSGNLQAAATIDRAAFGEPWQLDPEAIDDACRATRHHRARVVKVRGTPVAYAVSGRDGADGYLQRLAVDPRHQGQGIAGALVLDSLRWAGSQGARRVLVNTHVDNQRALRLYRRLGFDDLVEQLVVLERAVG